MKWFKQNMFHTIRYRLYLNAEETPYFLDHTNQPCHQQIRGFKVSAFGSGMGEEINCHNGNSYRIAKFLGAFETIKKGKLFIESLTERGIR